jgi:hypothetical protein
MVRETIDIPANARDVEVEQTDEEVTVSYQVGPEFVIVLTDRGDNEKYIDPTTEFEIVDTGSEGGSGKWEFCANEHDVLGGTVTDTLNSNCSYSDEYEYGWYFESIRIEDATDVL